MWISARRNFLPNVLHNSDRLAYKQILFEAALQDFAADWNVFKIDMQWQRFPCFHLPVRFTVLFNAHTLFPVLWLLSGKYLKLFFYIGSLTHLLRDRSSLLRANRSSEPLFYINIQLHEGKIWTGCLESIVEKTKGS